MTTYTHAYASESSFYVVECTCIWCPLCAGCGQNPARQAAMAASIPKEVPSATINMVCGSGLRAVAMGYQAIRCGDASFVVAGGQESMSQVYKQLCVDY